MYRKIVVSIITLFLLTNIVVFFMNIQPAECEPMIWTVDDDGPADFHTIQEAVNASSSGDTVFVWNGTYNENIVIDKPLSLVGENPLNTIVDGNKTGVVICLNSGNVNVSGFTIKDGGSSGLYIWDGHDCNVHNVIIMNNSDEGIACVNSYNCIFENLTTSHNTHGIYFGGTYDSKITNVTISDNNVGIYLTMSGRSLIVNNVIQENDVGVYLKGEHTFYHNGSLCGYYLFFSSILLKRIPPIIKCTRILKTPQRVSPVILTTIPIRNGPVMAANLPKTL